MSEVQAVEAVIRRYRRRGLVVWEVLARRRLISDCEWWVAGGTGGGEKVRERGKRTGTGSGRGMLLIDGGRQ